MKTPLVVVAMASLVLGIPSAFAAVPGINLGWSNCSTGSTTQNRSFACDANDRSFTLVGSWVLDQDLLDFAALDAVVDCQVEGGITPWFQWLPGECREGELSLRSVGSIAGCTNPYAGSGQTGQLQSDGLLMPDRVRYRPWWALWSPDMIGNTVPANTLSTGFVLGFSTQGTVDDGAGACGGCDVPACFFLGELRLYGYRTSEVITIRSPQIRNWCSWQAETGSCPGATPNRTTTWGAVKAMYR